MTKIEISQYEATYLKNMLPFLSKDKLRLTMVGMCLDICDKKCEIVATDGQILAIKKLESEVEAVNKQYVIPNQIIEELCKNKKAESLAILISKDSEMVSAEIDGVITVSHRIIDVKYPNYKGVISANKNLPHQFSVFGDGARDIRENTEFLKKYFNKQICITKLEASTKNC